MGSTGSSRPTRPANRRPNDIGRFRLGTGSVRGGARFGEAPGERGSDVQKEADRMVLANHAPPSVIISDDLEILHFRGRTGPFLEPASGKSGFNLLRMARQGLAAALQISIKNRNNTN